MLEAVRAGQGFCFICCFIIAGLCRHALDGHVLRFSLELLFKVIFKMFLEKCLFFFIFIFLKPYM